MSRTGGSCLSYSNTMKRRESQGSGPMEGSVRSVTALRFRSFRGCRRRTPARFRDFRGCQRPTPVRFRDSWGGVDDRHLSGSGILGGCTTDTCPVPGFSEGVGVRHLFGSGISTVVGDRHPPRFPEPDRCRRGTPVRSRERRAARIRTRFPGSAKIRITIAVDVASSLLSQAGHHPPKGAPIRVHTAPALSLQGLQKFDLLSPDLQNSESFLPPPPRWTAPIVSPHRPTAAWSGRTARHRAGTPGR